MARYGEFIYDDGTLYGTTPTTDNLLWTLIIAWDGGYSGENEALRMVDFTVSRGRDFPLGPQGEGLQHFQPGRATVILDNSDRRYDPFNTSSPLYPNVSPGKLCQMHVQLGNTGSNYGVFFGVVENIQPYNEGTQKYVRIDLVDALGWLEGRNIRSGSYSSVQYDNMVNTILNYITLLPDAWFVNSFTTKVLPKFWVWGVDALQVMRDLADGEMAEFFHARTGTVNFTPSDYTAVSTTTINEEDVGVDIVFRQPWEVVRNKAYVSAYPVAQRATSVTIFELDEPYTFAAGETRQFECIFRHNSFERVDCPGISYSSAMNSAADGSGGALAHTVTVGTPISGGVLLTVTNTSGVTGYLVTLDVTGSPQYALYESTAEDSDASSIAAYGEKTIIINTPWIQDLDYAKAYAEHLVSQYAQPQIYLSISLEDQHALQFGLDLWRYKVRLILPSYDIDAYYRIGKINHQCVHSGAQGVKTTFNLEPVLDAFSYP